MGRYGFGYHAVGKLIAQKQSSLGLVYQHPNSENTDSGIFRIQCLVCTLYRDVRVRYTVQYMYVEKAASRVKDAVKYSLPICTVSFSVSLLFFVFILF